MDAIKPYLAGKNQKCVGMFIPKAIVKKHKIDPSSVLLLITSNGFDDLQLKILREENLIEKEENGEEVSAEKVSDARSAEIIPIN